MAKLTIKEAKATLKAWGITLRKTDMHEYRVNYKDGIEATACYESDLE